jgi:hypothetical protein
MHVRGSVFHVIDNGRKYLHMSFFLQYLLGEQQVIVARKFDKEETRIQAEAKFKKKGGSSSRGCTGHGGIRGGESGCY